MRRLPDSVLLLLVGAALGPEGLSILSLQTLALIDPALPVALVAIGVLVGLGAGRVRALGARLRAAAGMEAALTAALVGGALLAVLPATGAATGGLPSWAVPAVLAICAVPSLALSANDPPSAAGRIGVLDGALAIVAGGATLAFLREPEALPAIAVLLQSAGVAVVIVLAGSLLIRASSSETEQRVFTAALLLLLGGAADYLSLSSLLSGVIAGLFLQWGGGSARDSVARDILHFQRQLVVLVLIVAGARIALTGAWFGIVVVFVLVRAAAKLGGAWAARRIIGPPVPGDLGVALLLPGVLGIAFALNVVRATGAGAEPLLATAAVGAALSDVIGRMAAVERGVR